MLGDKLLAKGICVKCNKKFTKHIDLYTTLYTDLLGITSEYIGEKYNRVTCPHCSSKVLIRQKDGLVVEYTEQYAYLGVLGEV